MIVQKKIEKITGQWEFGSIDEQVEDQWVCWRIIINDFVDEIRTPSADEHAEHDDHMTSQVEISPIDLQGRGERHNGHRRLNTPRRRTNMVEDEKIVHRADEWRNQDDH